MGPVNEFPSSRMIWNVPKQAIMQSRGLGRTAWPTQGTQGGTAALECSMLDAEMLCFT